MYHCIVVNCNCTELQLELHELELPYKIARFV